MDFTSYMSGQNPHVYEFGPFRLDIAKRILVREGEVIELEPLIFNALALLVQKNGDVVTKEEFNSSLWPGIFVEESRLPNVILNLRKSLGDDTRKPQYVKTVARYGYRLIADIKAIPNEQLQVPQISTLQVDNSDTEKSYSLNLVNHRKLIIIVLSFIVLFGIVIFAFWSTRRPTFPAEPANLQSQIETKSVRSPIQITIGSGLTLFPALSPDGSRVAYSSDQNGKFEIYVRQIIEGAREIQLTVDGDQNFQPVWSPDGQRIAYHSRNRGGIWIIPSTGGRAKQLTDFGSRPAWSPDGTLIAFQSNGLSDLGIGARNAMPPSALWIIPTQGGESRQLTQPGHPTGGHGSPSWSPDGRRIVFEVNQYDGGSVWSVSIDGDELKQISPGRGYDPIYAPDGKAIYFTRNGLRRVRIAPESGDPVGDEMTIAGAVHTAPIEFRYPSISADGKKIVYSALLQNSNIWSHRLSSNRRQATSSPLTHQANTRNSFLGFSPDGCKIAYDSGRTGTGFDIWIMSADGSNQVQLTNHPNPSDLDRCPSWFPEMDEVAFLSIRNGSPKILAIRLTGGKERALLDLGPNLDYFRLSPDGKQIAFTKQQDGVVNIWKIPVEGGEAKQLTFDKEMAGYPAWSPDGKWIALELRRGDDTHIAILPSDGGMIEQLTFDRGHSWLHSWSPDKDKIAFAGFRNGYWNVWWVSRSTQEQRQLTDYKKLNAFVRYPSWSPLGSQIVYEYTETIGNIWMVELDK